MARFRRPIVRYQGRADIQLAFATLAALVCFSQIRRFCQALALLKGSRGLGEEHEVMGEDAEDEFAGLRRVAARGQR